MHIFRLGIIFSFFLSSLGSKFRPQNYKFPMDLSSFRNVFLANVVLDLPVVDFLSIKSFTMGVCLSLVGPESNLRISSLIFTLLSPF